jgi:hypothetical protein
MYIRTWKALQKKKKTKVSVRQKLANIATRVNYPW